MWRESHILRSKNNSGVQSKMVFKICERISRSSFYIKEFDVIAHKKYYPCISLYNLVILYSRSLANPVVEMETRHNHQILLYCVFSGMAVHNRNCIWDGCTHTHNRLSLQWRHNGRNDVSNHQRHHCLLSRLFRHRSEKTSKLRVTGLCTGNLPVTDGPVTPVTRKMFSFDDVIMIPYC